MTVTSLAPSHLSSMTLPKSHGLTQALLAPADATSPGASDPVDGPKLLQQVSRQLQAAATALGPTQRVRVDGYLLRSIGIGNWESANDTPFTWSPRNARRALGLGAVRSLARHQHRTPIEAVAAEMARSIADGEAGRGTSTSLARWLAGVTPAAHAAVQAEAVTWATSLFGALDWRRFPAPPEIGRDRWWDCPAAPHIGLRGRAEVRAHSRQSAGDGATALFCLMQSAPLATSRAELALAALVDVLDRPSGPAPLRVVGWWPASGRTTILPVTHQLLESCAHAVAEAVKAVAQER